MSQPLSKLSRLSFTLLEDPPYLKSLLGISNPTIFEIGCNDGSDSEKLLELFPDAEVHCFEPDPRAIKQFRERVGTRRCFLHKVAIGAFNGTASFYQSSGTKKGAFKKDWDLSGSLNKPTGHVRYSPWVKFKSKIEITVQSLDSFIGVEWPNVIDLIWMDVQGGESNVIKGGTEAFKKTRYVYTEFGHWTEPLYEGQMNLEQTLEALGTNWDPIAIYDSCNLLVGNKKLVRCE